MFRTELPLTPHPQQLPHSARVLTLGSCFSDSIGSRLRDFKVAAMVNPFGTVFNPISACRLLRAAAGEDIDWQQHVVEARGRWQSFDLHAEVGADSPVELLQQIQTLTREVGVFLATADAVVLTLGSAYAYRLRETDELVSNCHKVAADKFSKELLTADEIIAAVAETHAYLRRINPRLRFILTVSPVRHLKDTLVLNSASKSMLRVACHYLSELLPDVSYFPAYELLLDDLRDYRFYASDMLHPSEVAENYIWERFTRTYFDAAFGRFKKEWEGIRQALGHRPLYAGAPEHRQFLESTLERLRKLSASVDVRMELLHLERELAALPLPPAPPVEEPEEFDDEEERIDIGQPAEEASVPESSARLVTRGSGVLVEPDQEEESEAEEADISSESAYEHAYSAALEEQEEENDLVEAEAGATETGEGEEPIRKKKRRSRGGAKRTKRKHARLAAEGSVQEGVTTEAVPETAEQEAAGEETATPEAAADVVYITEAELRGNRPPAPTPTPELNPLEETADSAAEDVTPEAPARRSRNRRRDAREERPTQAGGRNARKPLYATADDSSAEAVVPEEVPASVPEALASPEATPEALTNEQPADALSATPEETAPAVTPELPEAPTPARRKPSRSKPAAERAPRPPRRKKAEAASTELPTVAEQAPTVEAPQPAPADTAADPTPSATPKPEKAPAKPRSRRKAPAAEAPAPDATPVAPETPVPTARKRASKRPAPDVPATEARPPAEPETAPETPKRRVRPPRRKPAADAEAPETT